MGTPNTKHPTPKLKLTPLRAMGIRALMPMEIAQEKAKSQLHQLVGPFKPGQKPLQCYKCGGWGHTYKECASQGGINWRDLNGAAPPPEKEKGPETPKQN